MAVNNTKDLSIAEAPDDRHFSDDDEKVFAGSTVPAKYRGTRNDKNDMATLGRTQVLRRNFKIPTMLGFASTVLVAWEILPVISVYALEDGGTPIIFWGLIAGVIGMTFVYASLAEMASMFPTSGGQYHFVSPVQTWRPPRLAKYRCRYPSWHLQASSGDSAMKWAG